MTRYIFGLENWKKVYKHSSHEEKRNIWIEIKTSDGKEIFLKSYSDWLDFSKYIEEKNVNIDSLILRYKSNLIAVDTTGSSGVYLVKSVKGEFGGTTKQCFTVGVIKDSTVHKTMILTPELLEEQVYEDNIESCFEEAIVYHGKAKTITV